MSIYNTAKNVSLMEKDINACSRYTICGYGYTSLPQKGSSALCSLASG